MLGHGKLMLATRASVYDADTHSNADKAVAVQQAVALAYRTYDKEKPREREVREALVGADHGRARAWRCTVAMAATAMGQCGLT